MGAVPLCFALLHMYFSDRFSSHYISSTEPVFAYACSHETGIETRGHRMDGRQCKWIIDNKLRMALLATDSCQTRTISEKWQYRQGKGMESSQRPT